MTTDKAEPKSTIQESVSTRTSQRSPRPVWVWVAGTLAIVFGFLTLNGGLRVLLGQAKALKAAGAYIPFVVWVNVIAGVFYPIAGIALLLWHSSARWLTASLAAAMLLLFAAFGVHVMLGGAFERRTVIMMMIRSVFWVAIATPTWYQLRPVRHEE